MKAKVEVDCTAEEARTFLGLPDVTGLNEHLVNEMKARMDANMALIAPEEIMKGWTALGGQATETFRKLMSAAVASAGRGPGPAGG